MTTDQIQKINERFALDMIDFCFALSLIEFLRGNK